MGIDGGPIKLSPEEQDVFNFIYGNGGEAFYMQIDMAVPNGSKIAAKLADDRLLATGMKISSSNGGAYRYFKTLGYFERDFIEKQRKASKDA